MIYLPYARNALSGTLGVALAYVMFVFLPGFAQIQLPTNDKMFEVLGVGALVVIVLAQVINIIKLVHPKKTPEFSENSTELIKAITALTSVMHAHTEEHKRILTKEDSLLKRAEENALAAAETAGAQKEAQKSLDRIEQILMRDSS